ncbi:peptidoglycan-binding domain-containing protein [Mobilicoccus pelagius]|uniref:Peptidoglycan binding-like domain-containing protein n=1 Tax=Mobilicoccus pelagius NBRC 104925 TaxID=1089455 RepID=H5UTS3_9MICO|nr:peptidoglycan-binding domain-containing protein [Mobilicoccus pelagius]GAB49131.1 hypothetical protein MOPEL_096_01390 [Mobilicoccus pelagius NBRC 104925]
MRRTNPFRSATRGEEPRDDATSLEDALFTTGHDAPSEEPVTTPLWRRRPPVPWIAAAVVAALVLGTLALVLTRTTTTEAVRSAAQGPPHTVLTEPVTSRRMAAHLVTRGTITTQGEIPVECTPAAGGGEGPKVFTRPPKNGAKITEGGVLAAVNGRPVIALRGKVPAFRDMLPGSDGIDVRQLQAALRRLDHPITDRVGVFGPSTQQAVQRLYSAAGFTPVAPGPEDVSALRDADAAVRAAKDEVAQAQRVLRAAANPPPEAEVIRAQIAVEEAERALAQTTSTGTHRRLLAVQARDARAALAKLRRGPDTSTAQAALARAQAKVGEAVATRNRLAVQAGPRVPFCEVVFVDALPATVVSAAADPSGGGDSAASGGDSAAAGGGGAGGDGDTGSGDAPQGSGWATLAPGKLTLEATVQPDEAALVRTGTKVEFGGDDGGPAGTGSVTEIAHRGSDTVLVITPTTPFPAERRGDAVRVSLTTATTAAEVLAVPVAAVRGAADGRAVVTVRDADGTLRDVPVTAGLSADGFVEIRSVDGGGTLAPGDLVVVSR